MGRLGFVFRLFGIGACALSMLAQTRLLLDQPLAPGWLDGFVLGGSVFAYNFTHPDRLLKTAAWLAGALGGVCFLLPILMSSLPLLASSLPLLASSPTISSSPTIPSSPPTPTASWQLSVLLPVMLWLFYYGLQRPGNAGLRGVPAAKPCVVALAWAWVTVMLPVPPERWHEAMLAFFGRSAFIFALALAYDLADLAYDRRHGLATLAGQLGFEKTFSVINSALAVAALCCSANFFLKIYDLYLAAALLASLALSAWWLRFLFSKINWPAWQKVLIDALMPLQFCLVWFAELCFGR